MVIGYIVWKLNFFDENTYDKISKCVIYVFNPTLMLSNVSSSEAELGISRAVIQSLVLAISLYVLMYIVGLILIRIMRLSGEDADTYHLMTIFPNVGFMGLPIITGLLGAEAAIHVIFYIVFFNVLAYSLGLKLSGLSKDCNKISDYAKKMFINPGMIAAILCLIIFFGQIRVPAVLSSTLSYMSGVVIPMTMMMMGMNIARSNFKRIFLNLRMYIFIFIRIVAIPIIAAIVLKNFDIDYFAYITFVLQLSMPVGNVIAIMIASAGRDPAECTSGVILSTVCSIVTVPLVGLFL